MKILVVSDLYPPDVIGGYELGCRQVVDALRERGHEIRVLTTAPRSPTPAAPTVQRTMRLTNVWSTQLYRQFAPVVAHLEQSESLRVQAFNVHALLDELREFQPDVVYIWMLVGIGGLGIMAALHHLRVPWVWHLMDDVPLILCRSAETIVPAYVREFNRHVRGSYLACSQRLVNEIERGGIQLNDEVEVIPNWIAGRVGPPRGSYFTDGRLRIVTAAGLINRLQQADKGIDLLIEAAARLRDRGCDNFTLDIFGNSTDGYCPHLIHRHGLEEHVALLGAVPQSELGSLYASYDVFAFPTRPREPFGFAPLEAAARGCVPLLAQNCGIAEWFVHGVHCLKAPRTAEGFARTLATVMTRAIEIEPIGRRVAAVVRRDFQLDALLPRIVRVLERAAFRPRAAGGTPEEAYRMAVLAERVARVLIQESLCA